MATQSATYVQRVFVAGGIQVAGSWSALERSGFAVTATRERAAPRSLA
ncbi:hypothetical protein [Streptomyces sp. NBC_00344]